jgi:hypothetical protein
VILGDFQYLQVVVESCLLSPWRGKDAPRAIAGAQKISGHYPDAAVDATGVLTLFCFSEQPPRPSAKSVTGIVFQPLA